MDYETYLRLKVEAWKLVDIHHFGQMYGKHPYRYHIEQVFSLAEELGLPYEECLAIILHDILEDTEGDKEALKAEIRTVYGEVVYQMVWAVTGEGNNRAERKADMISKIRDFIRAANVKMSDRFCNMEQCLNDGNFLMFNMYGAELPYYKEILLNCHPVLQDKFSKLLEKSKNQK